MRAAVCNPEAGRNLGQGVVLAQKHQRHHGPPGRAELAAAVTLPGDDQHRHRLHKRVRKVLCGRYVTNEAPEAEELIRDMSNSTARGPRLLRAGSRHPISGSTASVDRHHFGFASVLIFMTLATLGVPLPSRAKSM